MSISRARIVPATRNGVSGWLDTHTRQFAPRLAGCDGAGDAALRDKLKRVEEEIAGLRDERAAKVKDREAAKEAFGQAEGTSPDSDEFKAAQDAVKAVGEIDEKIGGAKDAQLGILKMLGQSDPDEASKGDGDRGQGRGKGEQPGGEYWQSKRLFTDELKSALQYASSTKSRFGSIEIGKVADRDALKADIGGTTDMRLGPYQGIKPQLYRPLRVLDLIPTGTMEGNAFFYTQEGGTFLAAETAESAAKPEDGVTFTDATATAQTIAAWQKIRKQALEDVTALQSIIDTRLRYSVQRRLEAQVLNGDGSGSNLTGILQTSGILTQAFSSGANLADQVLAGVTKVYLADAIADGIVLHPTDWQSMLTAKAAGDGQYFSPGPFSVTPLMLWGLPAIPSPAIAQGTALVGDFEIGAQIMIREGVNVLISDSDQDDFIKNRVTMLGEMRAALPVWRPAAFCKVALA